MDALYVIAGLKQLISDLVPIHDDGLHIHIGMVIYLVAAWFTRSRKPLMVAFLWVFAIAVLNELFDLQRAVSKGRSYQLLEGFVDIFNSILWPAVWTFCGGFLLRRIRNRSGGETRAGDSPGRTSARRRGSVPPAA